MATNRPAPPSQYRDEALGLCAHASVKKEVDFFHLEIIEQVQIRHIAVFSLTTVANLDKLWLSSLAVIPHSNLRPRMIYNFTWSGLNNTTARLAPQEEMCFGNTLK